MSADILLDLMKSDSLGEAQWSPADLKAMCEHLILQKFDSTGAARAPANTNPETTILDVLQSEHQSAEALRQVKDFAKNQAEEKDFPREVARVVYIAAIVRALQAKNMSISRMTPATIERERTRCLTNGWLPEPMRKILCQGAAHE